MSDSTGRAIFSIAGQAIGGYFGGPIGAAIGGYLGSHVGYALFPLDPIEGPRVENPQITSASYGAPIMEVYGRFRVPGVIVDASEIREVVTEEDVGGKGGPEQTVRTYRYYADICLLLCKGPIVGVRRIWANGQLIYDVSDTADVYALMGSAQRTESIQVYTGSDTQLPDPTFEGLRGVGNVPAYRGTAYVVFENLELQGGVLPTFLVEVFTAGTIGLGSPKLFIAPPDVAAWNGAPLPIAELTPDDMVVFGIEIPGDFQVSVYRCYPGGASALPLGKFLVPNIFIQWRGFSLKSRTGNLVAGFFAASSSPTSDAGIAVYSYLGAEQFTRNGGNPLRWPAPGTGGVGGYAYYIGPTWGGLLAEDGGAFVGSSRQWQVADSTSEGNYHRKRLRLWLYGGGEGQVIDLPADHYTADIDILGSTVYVLAARRDSATQFTYRLLRYDLGGSLLAADNLGVYGHDPGAPIYPLTYHNDPATAGLLRVDDDGIAHVLVTGLRLSASSGAGMGLQLYRIDGDGVRLISSGDQPASSYFAPSLADLARFRVFPSGVLVGTAVPTGTSIAGLYFIPFNVATPALVSLPTIVAGVGAGAGIPSSALDVSQLSGTVIGFGHPGGQPLRAALEPLLDAYFFSVCDVDGKLVCVPRGGALDRALALTDLVREGEADAVPIDTRDESELPKEVRVGYLAAAQDYEAGSQPARRIETASTAVEQIVLPLVLGDTEAAQIADKRLNVTWSNATAVRFGVSVRHLALAPGSVVEVPRGDRTLRCAIRKITLRGIRLDCEAVTEHAGAFASFAVGQPGTSIAQRVDYIGQSQAVPMDVPLLRAGDDEFGFYLAASPLSGSPGWDGAQIYRATGDADYAPLLTITAAAVIGRTETALPAWPVSEARWDPFASVDVTLRYGTLSSTTESAPHRALIGGELVQFTGVTQLAAGKYRLSRLLRGMQGTQHLTGAHAAGEPFVLLTPATIRKIDDDIATLGVEQRVKAVTIGRTLASAPQASFTNTGRRIMPLPPLALAVSPQPNGDTVFTWRRAVRKYGSLTRIASLAVEETPGRSYELDIVNITSGNVLRTLAAANAESVTYSAAAATADHGSTEYACFVDAYQRNDRIGRGLRGRFVVSTAARAPVPVFLINFGEDAARVRPQMPAGADYGTPAAGLDSARTLFGVRSLVCFASGVTFSGGTTGVGTGDWYIGAWIFIPAGTINHTFRIVDRRYTAGLREVALGLGGSTAWVEWSSDLVNVQSLSESGGSALQANAWNHVAASRSGTTVRLFVNGQLKNTNTSAGAQASAGSSLTTQFASVFFGDVSAWRVQEIVIIAGTAWKTAAFTPVRAPYWFR